MPESILSVDSHVQFQRSMSMSTTLRIAHFRRRLFSLPLRILGGQVGPEDMYSRVSRGLYGSHIVGHCRRENTTWNELVRPLHAPMLHRHRPLSLPRIQVSCLLASMVLQDIRGIRQVPNFDEFGL